MKLPCEIIQDLLLLYADDACSPESQKAVEGHLKQCPACRRHMQAIQMPDITVEVKPEPEEAIKERVMKNGFRKLRRRWLLSVWLVFLLFPLSFLGMMGVHEYRGEGIAFSNLDDIFVAWRFMRLIEKQQFEKAASLLDLEPKYQEIQDILKKKPEDYLPSYEICMVDGEAWVAQAGLHQYQLSSEEDSMQPWSYFVLNGIEQILIPKSIWEQMEQIGKEEMEYREAYLSYFPIDTPWGQFYTGRINADELTGDVEITAELLCRLVEFLPYEIYQAAQEILKEEALQSYQWNQAYYAYAANMTLDDFIKYTKEHFIHALKSCFSNGTIIHHPHFADAIRIGGHWDVEISVIQQQPEGQSLPVKYSFFVQDGKVSFTGSSYPVSFQNNPIPDALRLMEP